jgi:acetyl-CoA carboxylase carboxyltransferase component
LDKDMATLVADLARRKAEAAAMGGPARIERQHARGRLNARERIAALLDPDSFFETGVLNHSDVPEAAASTPADGKIAGFGRIDGRTVALYAIDATVLAGAGGRVGARKTDIVTETAFAKGFPLVICGEGGGGRMPDILNPVGIIAYPTPPGNLGDRHRRVPLALAVLGDSFGETAFTSTFADFTVQLKGACMAVSSPRALEIATAERVSEADLGGWEVHARLTGLADRAADTEEECFRLVREFLSYLPSHCRELPPRGAGDPGAAGRQEALERLVPVRQRQGYDMRRVLETLCDAGSLFELKPEFDRSIITALARLDGHSVGVIANNPMANAGSMGPDGCDKMTSFILLCDAFHVPLVFLCDTPGFFVSRKAEERRMAGKITSQWVALREASVPKVSVILRKGYGAGYFSMGGPRTGMDWHFAWPTAEIGFVAPEVAVNIMHARRIAASDDPEGLRRELTEQLHSANAPWSAAGEHYIDDVIRPADTRATLIRALELARGAGGGFGERRMANWPPAF